MSIEQLRQILVEQTSPLEVIVFMFLVVAACLLVAAVFYAALMSLVWAFRLRYSGIGFRQVFLPEREQLRDYAPEYVLTWSTSMLLAYTTLARHALVQHIKGLRVDDVTGIAAWLPAGGNGEPVHDAAAEITLTNVIQPALRSGRSAEVKAILQQYVESESLAFDPTFVLAVAAILVILHLAWLAHRRYEFLAENPDKTGTLGYDNTAKGIRVLAVCVALLLAAPTLAASTERLVDSTLASIAADEVEPLPDELRTAVVEGGDVANLAARVAAMEAQNEALRDLLAERGARLAGIDAMFERIDAVLLESGDNILAHADQLGALDNRLASLETSAGDADLRLAAFEGRLADVAELLRAARADLDARAGTVDGLVTRMDAAEAALRGIIDDIGANARYVAGLDDRLARAEEAIGVLRRSTDALADLSARLEALESAQAALANRLGPINEALRTMRADIRENAGKHSSQGYLIVSGVSPAGFRINGQGRTYQVPSQAIALEPGTYTLVYADPRSRGVGDPTAGAAELSGAFLRQRAATVPQQQAPSRTLEVRIEADRTTGVTLTWGGFVVQD